MPWTMERAVGRKKIPHNRIEIKKALPKAIHFSCRFWPFSYSKNQKAGNQANTTANWM